MNNNEKGSSTLVITTLNQKEKKLIATFMGDSCYMILRQKNNKYFLFYISKAQQHSFNFPFQLGTKGLEGDNPKKAILEEHLILKNDIVLLGTDGLFDNLYCKDILEEVQNYLDTKEFDANEIARNIAKRAYKFSLDKRYFSPFSEDAQKNNLYYPGGKSDDITVVIGKVEN